MPTTAHQKHSPQRGVNEDDPVRLARSIRAGLPFRLLSQFQKSSGLNWDQIAQYAQIAPRTLTRRQSGGRLEPDESDRAARLMRIFQLAVDLFEGDIDGARQWLLHP